MDYFNTCNYLYWGGELILRLIGFCDAPLYYNNRYTGYNLVPNQDRKRFSSEYLVNEYSMRSLPLNDNENRILLIGDSVLNGGVLVDHSQLVSTLLEDEVNSNGSLYNRVLNISCGGWGIDNAYGVIEEYGNFDAGMFILIFNSHDAIGTISNKPVAGNSKSFPTKQYTFAIVELFDRYLIPRFERILKIDLPGGTVFNSIDATNTTTGTSNSEGWEKFYHYCKDNDIELIIYLHSTVTENNVGEYDENGKWIIEFAEDHNIMLVQDLGLLQTTEYKDDIHLNAIGHRRMSQLLRTYVCNYFQ